MPGDPGLAEREAGVTRRQAQGTQGFEAARGQGHSVRVLDPLRCYMRIASDGFGMRYKGGRISGYDAVIPRIGASVTR